MENLEDKAKSKKFPPSRIRAIIHSIKLGRQLKIDYPEIAEDYRLGFFIPKIIKKYKIMLRYNVNKNIAINSIKRAISGHNGTFNIDSYEGLITDPSELEKLRLKHNEDNRNLLNRLGLDISGLTTEERREIGSRIGYIGGYRSYELKAGIHGRTIKQRMKDTRKGIKARGLSPWSNSEKKCAYNLSQIQKYRTGKKINTILIREEINRRYHKGKHIRSSHQGWNVIYEFKKNTINL